jgi:hypothetical protein
VTSARRTLLAVVGVGGVAVAVGVLVGLAPSSLVGAASGLDATLATGVLGAGLLGYALRRRRASPQPQTHRLADATTGLEPADPGATTDEALRQVSEHGDAAFARTARRDVRERVRDTAVRAYARAANVAQQDAADAVAAGDWTDDRVAAAFVGDQRAPHYPLSERLRGWLQPERAFQRRADRATDAVHALATDGDAAMPDGARRRSARGSK